MFRKLRLSLFLLLAAVFSGYAQAPVVSITATPKTADCPPFPVSFNANIISGTGPFTYAWNFGTIPNVNKATSNKKNDVVIFNTAGTYNVTLVVTNASGSSQPVSVQITAYPVPVADFAPDKTTGCFPTTIKFTNTSPAPGSITKFIWDFGDGTQDSTNFNVNHLYHYGGSFPVVLFVENAFGCRGNSQIKMIAPIVLTTGVIPNFSSSLNSSCTLPVTANFNSAGTIGPGVLSYHWDFGDGNSSTLPNPSNNYAIADTFNVKFAVTSNLGCSDTLIRPLTISSNGSVTDFTVPDTVCINTLVNFTNTSSPLPNSSTWDYGDGTGPHPGFNGSVTYTTPGTKVVTLSNVFAGCTGNKTRNIFVVNPPVVSFTGTNLTSCKPPLVSSFSDNTPGAINWLWDFGDGTTSTVKNPPLHTYNVYGNFPVTLTVSNAPGCAGTKTDTVKIQKPTLVLNGLPAFGCAPLTFSTSATVNSVDAVSFYSWNFIGNGNSSNLQAPPPQTYGPGISNVICTITTTGGCQVSDTGIVKVGTIKPVPAFTFAPPSGCVKSPIQFTDQSTGGANQWFWSFGDGNIDSITNTPKHSYLKPGTFTVKLIAYNNGCMDSISKPITINPPLADFRYSNTCGANNSFTFKDTSIGAITWLWDFKDGTTFPGQNPPTHVFPAGPPKVYNVTLHVTGASGCTDSISYPVSSNQGTKIGFSKNPECANTPIFITAIPSNPIATYKFLFGDGNSSFGTSASVGYTYTKPGTYLVKVITTDINGCVDSSTVNTMNVNGPAVNYTVPTHLSCDPLNVTFNNLTIPNGSPIISYAWDFGDGSTSTLPGPTHKYNFQGVFQPKLTVTDNNGCSASLDTALPITVSVMVPHFLTSDSNYCPASFIQFNNTSTGGFNPTFYWNFGDGSAIDSVTISPIHNYPLVGQYTDTLTMKDTVGCIKKFWNTPKINIDTPNASFTISANYSACPPLNVHFVFTGHYAQKFSWFFGPSFSSKPDSVSFLYTQPGDYFPTLTVTSPGGCQVTSAQQKIHLDGPIGVFTYSPISGCDSFTVNFNVASSNVDSFTYIFNDGTTLGPVTSPTATHFYNIPGAYYPTVFLEDAFGCKVPQNGVDSIYVDHITKTIFKTDKTIVCDTGTVIFTDTSVIGSGTQILNYSWNFNDGSPVKTGLLPTITHFYNVPGVYNATLNITTLGGCNGTYTIPITVAASPKIAINGLINQCEPAILTFSGNELVPDPYGPLTWSWIFGNGTTGTGQNPPPVSYPKFGEYVVQLTATNTKGCSTLADTTQPNHLFIYPIPTVNAGADATICDTSTIQLNATGTAATYTWLPPVNGSLTCTNCPNPIASSPVSTYFIVQGTSLNGCTANDTVNITVNTQVTINATGTDSVCLGQSAQLNATGGAIYNWTPAQGLNDPNIANPTATPDASQIGNQPSAVITYTVTGYDNKKCYSDSKSIDITAFNYPVIDLVPNATINVGNSYQITSAVTTNIISLNWVPSGSLSCANCLTPVATPTKTTKYKLTAVNDGGCASSDSILVQVICNGANFFVPNSFSPNGDGVNDHFIVNGVGLNVIPSITIYNRWGQIVFQKSNFAANSSADAWDGTFNGQPAPPDVYIYTIQILCNNATLIPYHGNVTLIR